MTTPNTDPQPPVRFSAVLSAAVRRIEGLPAEYERLGFSGVYARGAAAQVAPALRLLQGILALIEDGNSDDNSPEDFCNQLAAGFRPPQEGTGQ